MKRNVLFLLAALMLVCAACAPGKEVGGDLADGLRVVASFNPMDILLREISSGAENLSISVMASEQGVCLHDYQLTPQDMKGIEGASIFISCGEDMEPFLGKINEQYPGLTLVDSGAGFEPLEHNGHIWLSLGGAEIQAANIAAALIEADSLNEDVYRKNLAQFNSGIEKLRHQAGQARAIGGKKSVILLHEGIEYIAIDLGLSVEASAGGDENAPLSAAETAEIISIAEDTEAILLCQLGAPESMYRSIVSESGAKVVEIDLMLEGGTGQGEYFSVMERNYSMIVEALGE